ncbi:hypothetical protein GCM10007291_50130 [Gemmobacter nanjingensis]|uniref:Uncharacterized protein n=1 Tax=Gemmobacter nanjingensis TaxID=488454 RepID=A0ABQ3FTR8_9RHOB|nr:phage tail tube protein [Gemmobacter nanjingensis]GHC42258.1 hypothetical protein GCM10007291_50130 [Gemmobacter nanjingensis]
MAARRWKKLAILLKPETVYGTDVAPAAADALIGRNVTFTPIVGERVSRDLILPYMGNQGVLLAGTYGRIEFDIEIAGSGAAGTKPKWGSAARICGMSETVLAGVSVTYAIIEEALESGSLYFVMDKTRHVLLGARGNMTLQFNAKGIPYFRFTILGLLGTITDIGAMPAVSQAGWTKPVVVSKANTVLTLHGWTAVAERVEMNLGNEVTPRFLIGNESMIVSDRSATGTAVVEARPIAEIDWFTIALTRARGAMSLIHGTIAGNIVEVTNPAVEVGEPTLGQTNNIANYSLPLDLCPDAGRDEMQIIVR